MRTIFRTLCAMLLSIAACGGGGGGTPSGTLLINELTAVPVVEAFLGRGNEIEEVSSGLVMLLDELDLSQEGTFDCPEGGTHTIDLFGNPPTGARITFDDCEIAVDETVVTLNGTLEFRVVDGDTVAFTVDLEIDDDGSIGEIVGDMTIRVKFGAGSTVVTTLSGNSLTMTEKGEGFTIADYRIVDTTDMGTGDYSETMRGYLRSTTFVGSVYFQTLEPIEGPDDDHPEAGVLILRGANGSRLRITLMGEDILLELDADGDGVYEDDETITWDDLD